MTNGDFIRSLDDDRMSRFLFNWSINCVSSFLEQGGAGLMNGIDLRKWMDSDEFICNETKVEEGFAFDQEFNMKWEGNAEGR
ncbi:MAG: hypothetical protein J6I53_07115 [Treponema sp.]|nr:hypothetical protein [Treponema sp.]